MQCCVGLQCEVAAAGGAEGVCEDGAVAAGGRQQLGVGVRAVISPVT